MPLPSNIIDPANDSNRSELVKLAARYEFPAFVSEADLDSVMNPEGGIAVTSYADPVRKKFACHTAAATWVSAMYFHDKIAEYHPKDREQICNRFDKLADFFAIRPAYEALVKKAEQLKGANELPDSAYAFVYQSDDGSKDRYYPMTTSAEVKIAAEWLSENRDSIPFVNRNTIGNKILQKAGRFGANLGEELTDFVEKQAGRGLPDPPEVVRMLRNRSKLATSSELRTQMSKLAETVANSPQLTLQPKELVKLAATVDLYDHTIKLSGKYTETIPRPEDVIFGATYTKSASDIGQLCSMQTGSIYEKDQLAKLAREDVEGLFGTDFVNEVSTGLEIDAEKIAAIASTLPKPDAELLENLLAEAGQHPQLKKSAEFEPITDEVLEELSKMYR